MGLFDEESSEDERPPPTAQGGAYDNYEEDDDEEEDPLDAFMNSLDDNTAANTQPKKSGGRLDVDAEEEATSHWNVAPSEQDNKSRPLADSKLCGYHDHDDSSSSMQSSQAAAGARDAMSNTFIRAGGNKQSNSGTKHSLEQYNNDEDGIQKYQQQEIDPLDKVSHDGVLYEPFRRNFYTPNNTSSGIAWRKQHDIVCNPSNFDPILGFGEVEAFPEEMLQVIARSGYDSPTLVQSQTLSVAISGHDALITAATGSGKTLAYIWPMVVHINDQPHINPGVDGPIGLVLTPTRELAKQVFKYASTFIQSIGGKAMEVAGGNRGTWELTKELKKGCEIVVSTPGRLIDLVKKKGTNLKRVTFVVLDEADRMLDMGFENQVSSILGNIRPDRQTLLLSATFGKRVEKVARGWLKNPVRIAIGRTGASSEHVDQHVMVLPNRSSKIQWLKEMLPVLSPLGRCIVFVASRADCDALTQIILQSFAAGDSTALSPTIVSIHGDKDQRDRNQAISQFKKQPSAILIATDVASRGLDVAGIMTVINFDAAKNLDSYVHRIGRAGRLQKDGDEHQRGVAYTLLTDKNADFALTLVESFEREGRAVSQELVALSQRSKRFGGGRKKNSKVGLGFGNEEDNGRTQQRPSNNYYGPASAATASEQPMKKKSRWG